MARRLKFQQITDDRFENNILELLQERILRIKELLNFDGISLSVSDPYLVNWSNTTEGNKQYRADFWVSKSINKISWNDIYRLINSVHPVPYKLI